MPPAASKNVCQSLVGNMVRAMDKDDPELGAKIAQSFINKKCGNITQLRNKVAEYVDLHPYTK